jgi:hypothetical protein
MKYKPSPLMETFSGSLADSTFSTGRGGDYIRRRVKPAQPRTAAQVAARSVFGTMSARWRALTEAQRNGWKALAATVTLNDRYGNAYKPTGQQLYVGANGVLSLSGDQTDDAPGSNFGPAYPGSGALMAKRGAAAAQDVITLSVSTVPANTSFVVLATPQFSAGQAYISPSAYRVLQVFGPGAAGVKDLKAAYEARFGRPVIGQKIALKMYAYAMDAGIKSQEFTSETVVIAA